MFHYSDRCSYNRTKSYTPAKTVQKCFRILEFIGANQSVRVPEIVKGLGLTRGNVHRLLATLEGMEYVEKLEDSKVRLSYKIFKLGSNVPLSRKLDEVAKPYMNRLSDLADETVNLGVLYAHSVIYLDKVECKHYLRLDHQIGEIDPLYCTAPGKVLLSDFSEEELEDFFRSVELRPYTKNTIVTRQGLLKAVKKVRRNGYAVDLKELNENLHCTAAPIVDYRNKIIAALSISGPSIRLTRSKIDKLKKPLLETAAEISQKMGCTDLARFRLQRELR